MPSSFVTGSQAVYVQDTTVIAATLPTNILAGDGVLAFVFAQNTVAAPAGWTLITSQNFSGPTDTRTIYCFRKNSVAATDAGRNVLFSQTAASTMGITYAVTRGAAGGTIRFTSNVTSSYYGYANPVSSNYLNPGRAANTVVLGVGSYRVASTATTPTATGGALFSGTSTTNHLAGFSFFVEQADTFYTDVNMQVDTTNLQNGVGFISVAAVDPQLWQSLADAFQFDSSFVLTGSKYSASPSETLAMGSYASQFKILLELLTDGLALSRSALATQPVLAVGTETLDLGDAPSMARVVTAADTLALTEALKAMYALTQNDTISLTPTPAPSMRLGVVVAQGIRAADAILAGRPVALQDAIEIDAALQVVRALTVLEQLRLSDTALAKALMGLSLSETVRLRDALWRFLSGDVLEQVTLTDTVARLRLLRHAETQAVTVNDTLAPKLLLRLTASDALTLDDAQVLKMLYASTVLEGLEISAGYVAPNGNFTAWAVNTRTGGTTEYTNYVFNSFAKMGLRYVGANSTGLYELDGADDAGTDIIADIKGGFVQFNGSRFAGFKAIYLGLHGGGDYFLKLEAGTGEIYTYKVVAESMETSKVWIGKGLRHRYLSFELISTGQDFDLESIEFVPMLAQRRV